jgi:hypothetical protein
MLRQSRQRSARRRVPQQIDLFAENAPTVVSRIFRTFHQATASVCMSCG